MRCIMVDVSEAETAALIVRGYLESEQRSSGAAIKGAIEGVLSDLDFEVQSEVADRAHPRPSPKIP